MFELLSTFLTAGGVGIIGSVASTLLKLFTAKQEHKQNLDVMRMEHEQAMVQIKAEAEHKTHQLEIESETAISVAEANALAQSYASIQPYDGDNSLLIVAEFMRRITRPGLTWLLVIITVVIYFNASLGGKWMIQQAVLAWTATAFAWWFCDRKLSNTIANKVL